MLVYLLLQAATLLPTQVDQKSSDLIIGDPVYLQQLQELAQQPAAEWTKLQALHPNDAEQTQVLIDWLKKGSQRQARLAAVIAAGTKSKPLTNALFRAGSTRNHEGTALACILAPAAMPSSHCAAMAYLAQSPKVALSVRAAAAGRLLEQGYLGIWPLCRSIFRSGTAQDERPIWADWKRGARWELPKRVLLLSLNRLLEDQKLAESTIEPNAAWEKQLEQIKQTELVLRKIRSPKTKEDPQRKAAVHRLFDRILKGDACAELALPWLAPHHTEVLRLNLASTNAKRRELARRLLATSPR